MTCWFEEYQPEVDEVERRSISYFPYHLIISVPGRQGEPEYHDPQYSQQPPQTQRPYSHKRRDSDTLRSAGLGSPTLVDARPSSRGGGISPPAIRVGRVSPPDQRVGRLSPPASRGIGRISPAPVSALATHRRSPTAPEPVLQRDDRPQRPPSGKTWASGDREDENNASERDREKDVRRAQQQPPPPQHVRAAPPAPAPAPAPPPPTQINRAMTVGLYADGFSKITHLFIRSTRSPMPV